MIAAAKLDPRGVPADPWYWRSAVRLSVTGTAVAIIGPLGEQSRKPGHAQVLIDGKPVVDRVGIWQGKFSAPQQLAGQVLFAWRWPRPGRHLIAIIGAPGKPGSTSFHMTGYYVVP